MLRAFQPSTCASSVGKERELTWNGKPLSGTRCLLFLPGDVVTSSLSFFALWTVRTNDPRKCAVYGDSFHSPRLPGRAHVVKKTVLNFLVKRKKNHLSCINTWFLWVLYEIKEIVWLGADSIYTIFCVAMGGTILPIHFSKGFSKCSNLWIKSGWLIGDEWMLWTIVAKPDGQ